MTHHRGILGHKCDDDDQTATADKKPALFLADLFAKPRSPLFVQSKEYQQT